jgi:uncharacterized protein
MKIHVDRLSDSPSRFEFEADPGWWNEVRDLMPEFSAVAESAPGFELEAYRMGADVYLAGQGRGEFELTCGRCLKRYRRPFRERFRLVLEPAGERVPSDPEGAESLARDGLWLSDELESGWFRGSEIELGRFFQELLALALPLQPLCREDCRGLCPRCGIDWNVETCDCEPVRSASPFAALGALREGDPPKGEG